MNEHLLERFGRSKKTKGPATDQVLIWVAPPKLNDKVRQYYEEADQPVEGGSWLDRPEIPTSAEILDLETADTTASGEVELKANRWKKAWRSKEEYLETHYELLREDAKRGLREAVSQVKFTPEAKEEAFNGAIGIYDKVHICGVIPASRGLANRVTFSLFRVGKKILWEQSKRLITGSLVALTPSNDMFKTKAIIATVAARSREALEQNPPEIDLFIARPEEIEIDPAIEWVMVEDRGGLYEAHRHTMLALQKMMREPFPLEEHLVTLQRDVKPPKYVKEHPIFDMKTALSDGNQYDHEKYENVNILKDWPQAPHSELDKTQLAALERILTKQLAIIQGPPGTGKTFVSTEAIRVLLANRQPDDPPILIACQTNHAVDQLLKHISEFEPEFVRLGSRSKEAFVKARTLYNLRENTNEKDVNGSLAPNAKRKRKGIEAQMKKLLEPLNPGKVPLDFKMLQRLGLLTERQAESLESGASKWIQSNLDDSNQSPFNIWLDKALVSVPPKQMPENYGFEYEEAELEQEQIRETEAENLAQDDDYDKLAGDPIPLADNFTCRRPPGKNITKDIEEAKAALKEQDLWKIPEPVRTAVYRYLQTEAKVKIRDVVRELTKTFNEWAVKGRIGNFEKDESILKKQKIIGMTLTGFSKYRGLLAALEPKIVLIEEAAESLEAPVTATCLASVQQLILVGDHQQLRPHCHVKALEEKAFSLNVSLFERLFYHEVERTTLGVQRRMIPEVRRLLYPIYGNKIKDHQSVLNPANRPNVPGMGGVNSLFFTHMWTEQRDQQMSAFNPNESGMIAGFVEYLFYNGVKTEDITVLTFYHGQRKKILKDLKNRPSMVAHEFNVKTVDSFQGDQNKVIILSLARSNDRGNMGFLNVDNRICVALSRAKCGLYIFGNGMMLYGFKDQKWPGHKTWRHVIDIMADNVDANPKMVKEENRIQSKPRRLDTTFPICCKNHGTITEIEGPEDWNELSGGCHLPCKGTLPCGHPCDLKCHPYPHEYVTCFVKCDIKLPCGHQCSDTCHGNEPCSCKICTKGRGRATETTELEYTDDSEEEVMAARPLHNTSSWKSFAETEPTRYASEVASATSSMRSSPEKSTPVSTTLVDVGLAEKIKELEIDESEPKQPLNSLLTNGQKPNKGVRKKWSETIGDSKPVHHERDWSKEGSLLD